MTQTCFSFLYEKIAKHVARILLNSKLHPVFFFIILFVSLLQTQIMIIETPLLYNNIQLLVDISNQEAQEGQTNGFHLEEDKYFSEFMYLVRWFDLSLYFGEQTILLYILSFVVWTTGVGIVYGLTTNLQEQSINSDIKSHYLLKLTSLFSFLLSYTATPTIIRSCIYVLNQPQTHQANIVLAALSLFIYVFLIYSFNLFVTQQYAWHSNRINSLLKMSNPLNYYNLYRLLLALSEIPINMKIREMKDELEEASQSFPYQTLVLCIIFCFLLGYELARYPVIAPHYNHLFQALIISSLAFSLIRIAEICSGGGFSIWFNLTLIIALIPGFWWFLERRTLKIILSKDQNLFSYKLKLLCCQVNKLTMESSWNNRRTFLDRFLGEHTRFCDKVQCKCSEISNFKYKAQIEEKVVDTKTAKYLDVVKQRGVILKQSQFKKPNQLENPEKNKNKEETELNQLFLIEKLRQKKKLWFLFILQMIEEKFSTYNFVNALKTEKQKIIFEMKELIIGKSSIQLEYEKKTYSPLSNNKNLKIQGQLSEKFGNFYFHVNYFLMEHKIGKKFIDFIQEMDEELCSEKFVYLQIKIINLRRLINCGVEKSLSFWEELSSQTPEQSKIVRYLSQIKIFEEKIRALYCRICSMYGVLHEPENAPKAPTYEERWKRKIKSVIDQFYIPYKLTFENSQHILREKLIVDYQNMIGKKHHVLSKSKNIYDSDSKVPMCVVDIDDEKKIGDFDLVNKEFWILTKNQEKVKACINDLLPTQFTQLHGKKMKAFLMGDNFELPPLEAFLNISDKLLLEVIFFGLLFPNLSSGLKFVVYIQETHNFPYTVAYSKKSGIIGYTSKLSTYLQEKSSKFESTLKNVIVDQNQNQIINFKNTLQFQYLQENFELTLAHSLKCSQESMILYYSMKLRREELSTFLGISEQSLTKDKLSGPLLRITARKSEILSSSQEIDILDEKILNNKSHFKIKALKIVNIVLLAIGIAFCCLSEISLQQKKQMYSDLLIENINFSNYYIASAKLSYTVRRLNVIAYEKTRGYSTEVDIYSRLGFDNQLKKYEVYQQAIRYYLSVMDDLEQVLDFDWGTEAIVYDVTADNLTVNRTVIYELFKNKYIMAASSFVGSQPLEQVSFDYLYPQISRPFSPVAQNLYSSIFNIQYIFLPALKQNFQSKYKAKMNNILSGFDENLLTYGIFVGLFITIFVTFSSLLILRLVSRLLWKSYYFFEDINNSFINTRIQSLKEYRSIFLKQFQAPKINTPIKSLKKKKRRQSYQNIYLKNQFVSSYQNQTFNELNNKTTRELKEDKILASEHSEQRENSYFKVEEQGECKDYVFFIFKVLPIAIFFTVIFQIQEIYNKKMYSIYQVSYPLEQRIRQIQMINNYVNEGPLEYKELSGPYMPWQAYRDDLLDDIYDINSVFSNNISSGSTPEAFSRYHSIRFQNFCAIPLMVPKPQAPQNVLTQCNQYQKANFDGKSYDEFFIYLIERARMASESFNTSETDPEKRREIYDSLSRYFFEQMTSYQHRIAQYIREGLRLDMKRTNYQFSVLIYIGEATVIISLLACVVWVQKLNKLILSKISVIKIVFKLLLCEQMKKQQRFRDKIKNIMPDFDYLV